MAMGLASVGIRGDGHGRDLNSFPIVTEERKKSKEIKALMRTDISSLPSQLASPSTLSSSWFFLRSLIIMVSSAPIPDRCDISFPSSRMKRQVALSSQQWADLFSSDGKVRDKLKLLNRVRWGGVEPGIRSEVWPFLLGVHDWDRTEAERKESRLRRREKYQNLRGCCSLPSNQSSGSDIYTIWRRIIRLDAVRVERIPCLAADTVNESAALDAANAAGLKDYDHLDFCQLLHAARLVTLLEAYAIYDPETGYCQGMADLLSPIAAVMEDDAEAFWCFAAFMRRVRQNFRLDEAGILRQLGVVSRIIRRRDPALFRHLQRRKAADCAFAYRMVVVLLRRELSLDQTMNLWEVLWAEQAAVQGGFGRRKHSVRRQQPSEAPPVEDLLLYVVAACVLQYREVIMLEKYGAEEIQGQCNAMAGNVDLWKVLDEGRRIVLSLHGKV